MKILVLTVEQRDKKDVTVLGSKGKIGEPKTVKIGDKEYSVFTEGLCFTI
jgi:hypothetical protein